MSGGESVVNKKLIIFDKDANKTQLFCGPIKLVSEYHLKSTFEAGQNEGVSGSIVFKQRTPYHPTAIEINLSGLNKRATQYHVHEFPIDADETSRCNHVNLGAPLDPYNVTKGASPALGTDTADKYEVGDMSGKYGLLTNKTTFQKTVSDPSPHIFGLKIITILIHNDKGAGLACADIIPAEAILLSATVNFTSTATSVLSGAAKLRQYIQSNGAVTQTIVVINLKYQADSSTKTPDHNWHTHILPVDKVVGVCSSVTGHYNPTKVSVAKPPYSSQCDGRHPYRVRLVTPVQKLENILSEGKQITQMLMDLFLVRIQALADR